MTTMTTTTMTKITARQLAAGDLLEPDGAEVLHAHCYAEKVVVVLKEPGKRQATYTLDPAWPLHRRVMTAVSAAAIALMALASSAMADGRSWCGWQNGVYVCHSTYEDDYSKTSTLCASGGIDAACSTKTTIKEQPKPYSPPAVYETPGGVTILSGR